MDWQMITKDRRLRWGTMTRMEDEVRMREELEEVRSRGRGRLGSRGLGLDKARLGHFDFQLSAQISKVGCLLALEVGGGCHYLAPAVSFGR